MWGLLRFYLIGKLLGGKGKTAAAGRGCGCFSILIVLAVVALGLFLLRGCDGGSAADW